MYKLLPYLMPTFAAVDIGSNSVQVKDCPTHARPFAPHSRRPRVTRLGEGVFRSGFLNRVRWRKTVKVLRRFSPGDTASVTDPVRVVATSAMREAPTRRPFGMGAFGHGWERRNNFLEWKEARLIHLGLVFESSRG